MSFIEKGEKLEGILVMVAAGMCVLLTIIICFSNPEYGLLEYGIGLLMIAAFVVITVKGAKQFLSQSRRSKEESIVTKNSNPLEEYLSEFRREYSAYFAENEEQTNPQIQNYTTQLYKNMLELEHKRLHKLGVKLDVHTNRQSFGGNPVKNKQFFDGKYEVSEVMEYILQEKKFFLHDKCIYKTEESRAAHYSMLHAHTVGENEVVCPNCGCSSTREKLIDGCDHCNTQFTVEDLGKKIANYTLRDDYQMQYDRFVKLRKKLSTIVLYSSFLISFILMILVMIVLILDEGTGMGPIFSLFSVLCVSGAFAIIFGYLINIIYFGLFFPMMQGSASVGFYSKKKLDKMRFEADNDKVSERRVRGNDPLFSFAGFVSNVSNKIATVVYADTKEQLNAFSEEDLSTYLPIYRNVLDVEIEKITLEHYNSDERLQTAEVTADMTLLSFDRGKVNVKPHQVKLKLVKNANCKTQAVCAPTIMYCEGCGASLSLEKGLKCDYCNRKVDLKKYDWTIAEWQ